MFLWRYVATCVSPVRCFVNRGALSWWHKMVLIMLHVSVLMAPMSMRIGNLQSSQLRDFVPQAMALLDEEVVSHFQQFVKGNQLVIEEGVVLSDTEAQYVAFVPEEQFVNQQRVSLIFTPQRVVMIEGTAGTLEQSYSDVGQLAQMQHAFEFEQELSRQWFTANRLAIVMTTFINTWWLFVTSFVIMLFGMSGFLALMKLNPKYDIANYSQAMTLALNCFGLPSVVAMFIGFVTGNPATMLLTHGIAFVFMVLWVYWTTHLNDAYVATKL